jgi:hypothetical protein
MSAILFALVFLRPCLFRLRQRVDVSDDASEYNRFERKGLLVSRRLTARPTARLRHRRSARFPSLPPYESPAHFSLLTVRASAIGRATVIATQCCWTISGVGVWTRYAPGPGATHMKELIFLSQSGVSAG